MGLVKEAHPSGVDGASPLVLLLVSLESLHLPDDKTPELRVVSMPASLRTLMKAIGDRRHDRSKSTGVPKPFYP